MSGLFDFILYWHWWVLAVILITLEMFSPAAIFMWISAAAGVVGFVKLAMPSMTWESQFLLFSVLSVLAAVLGRYWFKRKPIATDRPGLNRRGTDLIGRSFVVEEAIVNGTGRVRVGETTWKAAGPDTVVGESVEVTGVKSAVLQVSSLKAVS